MGVSVTHSYTTKLAATEPLAIVENGRVFIWPAGIGLGGPMISMPHDDWQRIVREVDHAYARYVP